MRRLQPHMTFANITSALALFIAIGGTAAAVDGPNPGQNTIGSEDIIGNEVKSDDIGNGRIFNLDIADDTIQSGKIKDKTVTAADLADQIYKQGNSLNEFYGAYTLDNFSYDGVPQGKFQATAFKNLDSGSVAVERTTIAATKSELTGIDNTGSLELLRGSSDDPFGGSLDDPGVAFDRATSVPSLAGERSFLYMRRNGAAGPLQMVVLWPNGERDVIAEYNTEE